MSTYKEDFLSYVKFSKSMIPGLLICAGIAVLAFVLTRGTLFDGGFYILAPELFIDNPVFGLLAKVGPIVLALLICLFINVKFFNAGGSYAGKFLLRIAIILMGARVTFDVLMTASIPGVAVILGVLFLTLVLAMKVGKKLHFPWDACALTGTGNGICGVSATLSVAPVINAEKKYVDAVVGVISVLGILGVFLIPALALGAGLTDAQAEVFIGGTLHEIGNVIPAADLYTSLSGGQDIGPLAIAYKMIRVAMLVVVAAGFGVLWSRRQKEEAKEAAEKPKLQGFLILFVGMAVFMSALIFLSPEVGKAVQSVIVHVSVTTLTIAMAGVGLSMNLRQTLAVGKTMLPFSLIVWGVQTAVLLVLIKLFV
ncbi:MAG: putative sulfate exporter family transporter [Methanocorpusculum sp.]|nr:putative sulfate exporter family transporter [Methanocorpusculum sp.]